MATWKQVRDYVQSNYNASYDEEGDVLGIEFTFTDGRSQKVLLTTYTGQKDDTTWLHIVSFIGKVGRNDIGELLAEAGNKLMGGIATISGECVYRLTVRLEGFVLDSYFDTIIQTIAITADAMEEAFVGDDDN